MSAKLTKLIVTTILNHGVKGSEVKDWHFNVREVNGIYFVDLSTTVAISPKTHLTKHEKIGKYQMIAFVVTFLIWLALSAIGALVPNASLGRELVLSGGIPGFIAQLLGARFLVRGYRKHQEEEEEKAAEAVLRKTSQENQPAIPTVAPSSGQ